MASADPRWKDGLDTGLDVSKRRVAQLSLDLALCRETLTRERSAKAERERLMQHWRAEAQWWREEHDKVHAEFCEFVRAAALKLRVAS